jgi:glycerol-3-phosphate dehydrogenase (NAD(P)+)
MKIAYLGVGAWGFTLANLLAGKGYNVVAWTNNPEVIATIQEAGHHPFFPDVPVSKNLILTAQLDEALAGADLLVESVTSAGVRSVFEEVKLLGGFKGIIVLTSKGIEQNSGLLTSEVVMDVLGEDVKSQIGSVSGPSYADDVVRGRPASVVGSGYDKEVIQKVCDTFTTPTFRVYPNSDIRGVSYGGALKNIVAIGCGAVVGLNLGESAKAALMTRGLHEMCKLAVAQGCNKETLYGLSGMGDLCVTCASTTSRNFKFGKLLAQGISPDDAKKKIGMVVEGAYTCVSALQIGKKLGVPMPITEGVYGAIYKDINPQELMAALMGRAIKEEHL